MIHHFAIALFAAAVPCTLTFDAPQPTGLRIEPPPLGIVQNVSTLLAIADFDGDGHPDLLTPSTLFLDFARPVALPVSLGSAREVRITDVNRDGLPDIVAMRDNDILVLLNRGGGSFTPVTTPHPPIIVGGVGDRPWAFGDFNGDGLLDAFVVGAPIYEAVGDGTFKQNDTIALAGKGSWIAADMDGDHLADLIGAQPFGAGPLIFYHRQLHGFDLGQVWPVTVQAPLLAADFDRDGRDDLFVPGAILFGNGLAMPLRTADAPVASAAITGDFNRDGAPDVAAVANGIEVRLNDGHGNLRTSFQLPVLIPFVPGDADGDGVPDLVVLDHEEVFILHGNGDGTFRVPRVALVAAGEGVSADFDGDGADDIALPGAMAWNNGDGTFRITPLPATHPVAAADVDGDGIPEVITIETNAVRALRVRPDGSVTEVGRADVSRVIDAKVGDFSGTHVPELALLIDFPQQHVEIIGFHAAAPRFTATPSAPGRALSLTVADLNGDGADDIIVTGGTILQHQASFPPDLSTSGFISTYLSTRSSFAAEQQTRFGGDDFRGAALYKVVAGDFDGDGHIDVAAATVPASNLFPPSSAGERLVAFFGDGRGGFRSTQEIALPTELNFTVTAADFNGDGRTDIAVNGASHVLLGTPAGLSPIAHYFGPDIAFGSLGVFAVRSSRRALPSLVVTTTSSADAFLYRPVCEPFHSRAVRH